MEVYRVKPFEGKFLKTPDFMSQGEKPETIISHVPIFRDEAQVQPGLQVLYLQIFVACVFFIHSSFILSFHFFIKQEQTMHYKKESGEELPIIL